MRRLTDPQHGLAHREHAARREVVHAEVEVKEELIPGQGHPLGPSGDQLSQPRVDDRHLLVRVRGTVRCAGTAAGEPVVPDHPGDPVEDRLPWQVPLTDLRTAHDQHQPAVVAGRLADVVEPGFQALAR